MATIRKRGEAWQAIVRQGGKPTARSFPSKQQAEAWAAAKEAELRAGKLLIPGVEQPTEVYVVFGEKAVRIPVRAWKDVMLAAGLMADNWQQYYGGLGRSQARIDAGLAALNKLSCLTP